MKQGTEKKISARWLRSRLSSWVLLAPLLFCLSLTACTTDLQTRFSENWIRPSSLHTIAILPVESVGKGHQGAAKLFRKNLHANLKQSSFHLLEPYVVNSLLKKNGLTLPSAYAAINPMRFGEALGVDAVLISRLNRVDRSYLLLHSSIQINVSVQMVDTRTGEVLWRAEQIESDYQGIGKIPTGLISALVSPLYFVTNKFNLEKMTSRMTQKLTQAMKNPELGEQTKKFRKPLIASAARRDIQIIAQAQKSKAEHSPFTGTTAAAPRMLAPVSLVAGTHSGLPVSPKNQPTLFTIQVGAYKKKDSAKKLTRTLTEKGYKAFIAPTNKVKVPLYRVQVEQFNKRAEALELAKKLQNEENLKSFVTSFHLI